MLAWQHGDFAGGQSGIGRRSDPRGGTRNRRAAGRGRSDRLRHRADDAAQQSEMNRPETIEETAALVDEAGGHGIAVQVDHLVPGRGARAGGRASKTNRARLHVLVNDIWGATTMEWNKSVWESTLDIGLRTLRLAVDTHAITSHFAIPLLIKTPGGLVVEVNDGTTEYNATHYRVSFFYDLAKASVNRMAFALAHELQPSRRDRRVAHARLAAIGGDARRVRRHRIELARRDSAIAPLRDFRDAGVCRPGGRGAGAGSRRVALERTVAVERPAGEDLRLHRSRRQSARRLEIPHRSAGRRKTGRRHRLSLTTCS